MTDVVPGQQLPRAKKEKEHEDVLHEVMEKFKAWEDYTKKLHPEWERDTKLYNNIRVERGYEGVADTFVPMPYSTVEAIKAAIVTGDLSIRYQPQDIYKYLLQKFTQGMNFNSQEEETSYLVDKIQETMQGGALTDDSLDVLNALFMYYWESGDWDLRIEELLDSGLVVCNGALWLTWDGDRPKLEFVPFRDYIFDINGTNDSNVQFCGRRRLVSLDSLKDAKVLDPIKQTMIDRYKDLDKIPMGEALKKDTAKEILERMFMGSLTEGCEDDVVELIEIQTLDRWYTIANRKTVIEDIPNAFKAQAELLGIDMEPFLSGITWANNRNPSLFVGRSEISTFWREAERLNDTTNQKSDAVTRSLLQTSRIDPQHAELAKKLNTPGAVIPAPSGTFEYFTPPVVPGAAFNEEASIKNNIRETTATDQIVKGVQSTSDVTATEAKLQVASAGQRIELKVKSLERGPLKRLARNVYSLVRLFVTDPMLVPVQTNKGVQPQLFNPKLYTYDFEPRVQLNINAKYEQRRQQGEAVEALKIMVQDPTNNLEAVKRIIYPKLFDLDRAEIDEIITKPQAALPMNTQPGAMPEMGMPSATPPQPIPETAMQGMPA